MWSTCHVSFPDHLWTVKCRISLKKAMGHGSLGKCQSKRRVQLSSWNYISDAGSGNSVEPKQASFCFLFWVIFGNIKSFVGMTECSSSLTIALYQWDFPFHGKFLFWKPGYCDKLFSETWKERKWDLFVRRGEFFPQLQLFHSVFNLSTPFEKKKFVTTASYSEGTLFFLSKGKRKMTIVLYYLISQSDITYRLWQCHTAFKRTLIV